MPVFAVGWTEGEYSQAYEQIAYFSTRVLAEASCPSSATITEIDIRDEPLKIAIRYRGWIDERGENPKIKIAEDRYCEWQPEFSAPFAGPDAWGYNGNRVEGPDRAQVEKALKKMLTEAIRRKQTQAETAARAEEWRRNNTKVRCPEHGDIGWLPNDSPLNMRCPKCGRLIDVAGNVSETLSEAEFRARLRAMGDEIRGARP